MAHDTQLDMGVNQYENEKGERTNERTHNLTKLECIFVGGL